MFGTKKPTALDNINTADRKVLWSYFRELMDLANTRRLNRGAAASMPASFAVVSLIVGGTPDLAAHMAAAAEMRPIRASVDDQYPNCDIAKETAREALAKKWAASDDIVLLVVSDRTLREIASNRDTRKIREKAIRAEAKEKAEQDRQHAAAVAAAQDRYNARAARESLVNS